MATKPAVKRVTLVQLIEKFPSPVLMNTSPQKMSEYQLGLLHDSDEDIPQSKKLAFECFKSVAARGHAEAQYYLGEYYLKGTGTEKNEAEGFRFMKLAADQGIPHASYGVGSMYLLGVGVTANRESGIGYMRQAARLGHILARDFIHSNRL